MKSFISSLILTGALWVSIPMSAQRPMNERVHDKVATKEAPRIQFVGKKQGPNLFQSAAASVTADFSCQSAGSAITVWKEDFDDGTDGWTFTNAEDFSWTVKKITSTTDPSRDFSTYDPDDVQSLYIEGPYQSFKRGIAMATSGQIDVPANAMLKGYIGFTQNMDDYCRLQISVSADAFETSEILWNSADEDGEKPWRWHEFSVSLEKYSGRKDSDSFYVWSRKKRFVRNRWLYGRFRYRRFKNYRSIDRRTSRGSHGRGDCFRRYVLGFAYGMAMGVSGRNSVDIDRPESPGVLYARRRLRCDVDGK